MSSSFPLPLSENEEKVYVELMEAGDPNAKDVLIERNLRLVAHIARKYTGPNTSQEDLISIGTIGLIKAINTYTSKRAARLATYAARCIENEILMSIRTSKKNKQEVSISLPIGTDKDGNEISFNDILGTDPDEIVDNLNLKFQVRELYGVIDKVLSPREREIINLRYGLDGQGPRTQREIAASMDISRSYVSRIEKKALSKLRSELEKNE
ncbi:RNA polymerase sigma-28 factor precursor [uncultured Eubacterium sp.]|uniref:RNA polymerase sporulation sigma factor SigK n=1 Tax=Emergencia sp. TaxID=1926557 RepID=UPI0008210FB3|nr:RNA polymerase sigma-28 factor precursor [uncultured Eubacterium sp.]